MNFKFINKLIVLFILIYLLPIKAQWINLSSGTTETLLGVQIIDLNSAVIVGVNGLILRTTNAGQDWVTITSGTTFDLRSVFLVNSQIRIVVGYHGTILKTSDGGTNWSLKNSNTTNDLFNVFFINNNIGFAVGTSIILKTTNGGDTWYSQPVAINGDLYAVHFYPSAFGLAVGQNGAILKSSETTDVGYNFVTPQENFYLQQNYPNPFNPQTRIEYEINQPGFVTIKVYDSIGNLVENPVNDFQLSGQHSIIFDGTNLSSGTYVYTLKTNEFFQSRKMVLLK